MESPLSKTEAYRLEYEFGGVTIVITNIFLIAFGVWAWALASPLINCLIVDYSIRNLSDYDTAVGQTKRNRTMIWLAGGMFFAISIGMLLARNPC
ncbi:hypothetical protein A2333_02900 [Candidatus Wolfebacteria bacterium RIFOXYB2_FULL_49_7]|nr:MAG: hypothetical protein A2333_02900 [Candidatus Wolfebacteria bacterium RIFOXYB2_FULL_49_7]